MYDLPDGSSWDPRDEHLGQILNPGESVDTYLPSAKEDIDSLTGRLLWRVHFRKGYNPNSMRGVTTVVEVVFDTDQIENEASRSGQGGQPASAGKKEA